MSSLFSTNVEAILTKSGGSGGAAQPKASITGENEFGFFILSKRPEVQKYELNVPWGELTEFESFWANNKKAPAYEWSIVGVPGKNLEFTDSVTIAEEDGNFNWEDFNPGEKYIILAQRGKKFDSMTFIPRNIEITKLDERMLVEGKFDIEAKVAKEIAGEKYNWSIAGSGKGEFEKPNPSDEPKTKFTAKKITDPNKASKLKVIYGEDEDEKDVTITKCVYFKNYKTTLTTGKTIKPGLSRYISPILNWTSGWRPFLGAFLYELRDQDKKSLKQSKFGGTNPYIKETNIKTLHPYLHFKVNPTKNWKIPSGITFFADRVGAPGLYTFASLKKTKKIHSGSLLLSVDHTWQASVEKGKHTSDICTNKLLTIFLQVKKFKRGPRKDELQSCRLYSVYIQKGNLMFK